MPARQKATALLDRRQPVEQERPGLDHVLEVVAEQPEDRDRDERDAETQHPGQEAQAEEQGRENEQHLTDECVTDA